MSKKIIVASLVVLCIGILLSFRQVRDTFFVAYDLVSHPTEFELGGKSFSLSGNWIVDEYEATGVTVRVAGLVKQQNSLITLLPLGDISNPCGDFGNKIELEGKRVSRCLIKNTQESNDFYVYVLRDLNVVMMFTDELIATSFLKSVTNK